MKSDNDVNLSYLIVGSFQSKYFIFLFKQLKHVYGSTQMTVNAAFCLTFFFNEIHKIYKSTDLAYNG